MVPLLRNVCLVTVPLLLAACGADRRPVLHGYVEAEPIRIAAAQSGRLTRLAVDRGDVVKAGQVLFELDQEREAATVAEAEARLAQAEATSADLSEGQRPQELAVVQADLRAADATLRQARSDLQRNEELARNGFVSGAGLDQLRAQRDAAAARVAELQARVEVARLAARPHNQAAARAATQAARAGVAQQRWVLQQKSGMAPVAARVEDRYYQTGEWVPAGAPVISLLTTDANRIRFFVPEPQRATLSIGTRVTVRCDGCATPLTATVSHVSREAEFAPPLIYSTDNRARLVWRVEARPIASDAARLLPGQPVDVELP